MRDGGERALSLSLGALSKSLAKMLLLGPSKDGGIGEGGSVDCSEAAGGLSDSETGRDARCVVFAAIAASSMMTDGTFPLVYDAVNSQGSPDFKHKGHGQRPVQRVFFLSKLSSSPLKVAMVG